MKTNNTSFWVVFLLMFLGIGCQQSYTPKPKAFPRMILPAKSYQVMDNIDEIRCPFTFEIPKYSNIDNSPNVKTKSEEDYCWMDVVFQDLNARFHISYKEINQKVQLPNLIEDAYKLTSKHMKKAEYIDERLITTDKEVYGLFSDVGGNAASSMQFYLTDSTQHFLYGALYFSETPNYDSIRPAIEFIKKDMLHLIETFEWKEPLLSETTMTASR